MNRIRRAKAIASDREAIREVHLSAFPENERRIIATLAVDLLSETTTPETIALVAEVDGVVAGHIAFSPVFFENEDKRQAYILAPLGIKPEFQRNGIGSELIENGKKQLLDSGVNILFVYGDPKYYGQFGFSTDTASHYLPPYELEYPFGWQAIILNGGDITDSKLNVSCLAPLCNPELW